MQGSPLGGKFHWPGPAPRLGPWASSASCGHDSPKKGLPRELLPPMASWLDSCRQLSTQPPSRPPTQPGLLDSLSRSNEWNLSPPMLQKSSRRAALQASSWPGAMERSHSHQAVGWRPSYEAVANPSLAQSDAQGSELLCGYGDEQAAKWRGLPRLNPSFKSPPSIQQSASLPALVDAGQPRSKVGCFGAYL